MVFLIMIHINAIEFIELVKDDARTILFPYKARMGFNKKLIDEMAIVFVFLDES